MFVSYSSPDTMTVMYYSYAAGLTDLLELHCFSNLDAAAGNKDSTFRPMASR